MLLLVLRLTLLIAALLALAVTGLALASLAFTGLCLLLPLPGPAPAVGLATLLLLTAAATLLLRWLLLPACLAPTAFALALVWLPLLRIAPSCASCGASSAGSYSAYGSGSEWLCSGFSGAYCLCCSFFCVLLCCLRPSLLWR